MNLAIDIGNTLAKTTVLQDGQVVDTFRFGHIPAAGDLQAIFDAYPDIDAAIMIAAREASAVEWFVRGRVGRFVRFAPDVPVPLENRYQTPGTLGPDRLAAAVGAAGFYAGSNVLVVDFGTAITIDVVTGGGEYLGGNISPGAAMRLRALHKFTESLPLHELCASTQLIAPDSQAAIESGVVNGIVYEIEGYIARVGELYEGLKIIFTGGDGIFFAKRFKNPIFATYDLVAYGLNRILEYNAE